MKAPEEITTQRLLLRRPRTSDVQSIFDRYSSDPEVTRYLSWPCHTSLEATRAFVEFSNMDWEQNPGGPYLIFANDSNHLLGGTGFGFETPYRASTGYVLARDAWGQGYAPEALNALAALCPALGIVRFYAYCHVDHGRSARVLEKCGFEYEGMFKRYCAFPNHPDPRPADALCYARVF